MFFGVTVPCILSIFSVILFLRMGYVLGQVRWVGWGGVGWGAGSVVACTHVLQSEGEVAVTGESVQRVVMQNAYYGNIGFIH